mgnify:CR=1 FL=1
MGTAGNQVATMTAALGTDIDDPLKRLEAVRESTHASKAFAEASDARSMVEFSAADAGRPGDAGGPSRQPLRNGQPGHPTGQLCGQQRARPAGAALLRRCPPRHLLRGAAVVEGMGLLARHHELLRGDDRVGGLRPGAHARSGRTPRASSSPTTTSSSPPTPGRTPTRRARHERASRPDAARSLDVS